MRNRAPSRLRPFHHTVHVILQSVQSFSQAGCRAKQYPHSCGSDHETRNLVALFAGGLGVIHGYFHDSVL